MTGKFFRWLTFMNLIIAAHVIFTDPEVTHVFGNLCENVTLQFTFDNKSTISEVKRNVKFGVYTTGEKKIMEYPNCNCSFDIFPQNSTISYHMKSLTMNDARLYYVSVYGLNRVIQSHTVNLTVVENNCTSVLPVTTSTIEAPDSGSSIFFSSQVVTIVVVSVVVLFAAVLPFLMCSYKKNNGENTEEPNRTSNPTLQEVIEEYSSVAGPSVIYSVLDFPKRPPKNVEFDPDNTEYAYVSYHPEKMGRP